jgi:hypothetical protein
MSSKKSMVARGRTLGLAGAAAAAALAAGWATAGPALAQQAPSVEVDRNTLTLTVTGTGDADRIVFRLQSGTPSNLEIDFDDDGTFDETVDRNGFNRIVVLALGGDDSFRIDQVNGTIEDEALVVDGGRDNDSLNGGNGAETFLGRGGNDAIDGNRGDDVGIMGSGDDSFRWDPGDGSDRVEGERGFDTLDFNGAEAAAENMSLSAEGDRSIFLRDVATIRMDMGQVERLDLTTLGNTDTFTLNNMSGTDFKQADVDLANLAGAPDGQADIVTVNGTRRGDEIAVDTDGSRVFVDGLKVALTLGNAEAADTLQINGETGDDEVDVADGVAAIITPSIDLGADQD